MRAVLRCRYDDDEPASPWSFALYIDERGDERQHEPEDYDDRDPDAVRLPRR
jgi:hypothetical protein